jgi:flagellar basal-body rod protein FlgC
MPHTRIILAAALLFIVGGCAATASDGPAAVPGTVPPTLRNPNPGKLPPAPAYVTVPVDNDEPEVIEWLRSNNVRVEEDINGDERVFDSPASRRALVQYRRMLQMRLDVIAENIANSNTTRDARGEKVSYRPRHVVADNNGGFEIKPEPSPFQRRYEPEHPDADADGYVLDPIIEYVNALAASREYEMVTRVLGHFDPTYLRN